MKSKTLKKMMQRLSLALLAPLLFLVLLESYLILTGYGYPTSFLLPVTEGTDRIFIDNQFFGYRFFQKDISRTPVPIRISQKPATNRIRIVILGESAAMGEPTPEIGMAPLLDVLLSDIYPATEYEIINAAMTAINSHVIREIAASIAQLKPDICILYMGNNEVVGPFGPGTVLDSFSTCPAFTRLRVWLSRFRFSQWIHNLTKKLIPQPSPTQGWEGMAMFMSNTVEATDTRMDVVYAQFSNNLNAIVETLTSSGAHVILCTVAVNLYDQEPFAGSRAQELFSQGHTITQSVAQTRQVLSSARDEDQLRFRADNTLNTIIRTYAHSHSNRVYLFDAEKVACANSMYAVPGDDLFWDHVHLNPFGTYLLVSNLVPVLQQAINSTSTNSLLSFDECIKKLPWSTWSEIEARHTMARRLNHAPFPNTPHNRKRINKITEPLNVLEQMAHKPLITPHLAAIPSDDTTARLYTERGRIYLDLGAYKDAQQSFEQAIRYWPHRYDIRGYLSLALAFQTNTTEAVAVLMQIPEPDNDFIVKQLLHNARILRRSHQAYSALFLLNTALKLAPDNPRLHYEMTLCYAANGNTQKAEALFKQIATSPGPYQWKAKLEWALFLALRQRWPEAQKLFLDLMHQHPDPAEVRLKYAMALVYAGYPDEALNELNALCQTHPDYTEAQQQLDKLNIRCGNPTNTVAEYGSTITN